MHDNASATSSDPLHAMPAQQRSNFATAATNPNLSPFLVNSSFRVHITLSARESGLEFRRGLSFLFRHHAANFRKVQTGNMRRGGIREQAPDLPRIPPLFDEKGSAPNPNRSTCRP